jgi:hypothetical protein
MVAAEDFWRESAYARKEYIGVPLTDLALEHVQRTLRYRLPSAYVALMKQQNGGFPAKPCYRTESAGGRAEDHVRISGIFSVGSEKSHSLCGPRGSEFWISEWGYPAIGVYFADCPSAGHDLFCFDYRACGPTGEPRIVHVDQERDYEVTRLAEDFASFLCSLEAPDAFDAG